MRAPVMAHTAHSTESDWFLPYDGPIEPPPPAPTRHPFAAADISQPKPIPARARSKSKSKSGAPKSESRETDDARSRSRSRSRDAKRKSQRSYVALDAGGGVGAWPVPDPEREHHREHGRERSSTHSDYTFGVGSSHTYGAHTGHTRGQGSLSLGLGAVDPQYVFPPGDEATISTGGKSSDPPLVFASHPFRMHTGSPPPRSHTASASTSSVTPWVRTITASPTPPAPAPMRKRTLTYQPGLVSTFGSANETRVGYRESGAFIGLDAREREKIRPTLLPPSLSLLGKGATLDVPEAGEHGTMHKSTSTDSYLGLRGQYDLRSHPYATAPSGPVRETRFGSVSTTTTTTTGGTGKPPIPPRPAGLKLKSSLKASASTPELRLRIPVSAPAAVTRRTPDRELSIPELGVPVPRSAGTGGSGVGSGTGTGTGTGLEVRTICDALIFARPRFRVAAHEITPPPSPKVDNADGGVGNRASVIVGEGGLKGLTCFPGGRARGKSDAGKEKGGEKQVDGKEFQTVEEVLRDTAELEKQREEWNALGQSGLLNNRTRSLSRSQTRVGGARVGGTRQRRETVGSAGTESNSGSVWGTLKLKRSVEMLAASALSQGHGHAPTASVSSSHKRGAHGSVSTVSHTRGASASVVSRAHSRADSWGQRVVCGSRSRSSIGDDAANASGHHGQSSERLLRGSNRGGMEDFPVVDIRPVPVGDTHRARAPPPPPPVNAGFGVAGPSGRGQMHTSPAKTLVNLAKARGDDGRFSPASGHNTLHPAPSSPAESVIGLALSSPSGSKIMLPNHPFAQRAGAYPAVDLNAGLPTGPETIAMRHRHPPRSSGSTERARLDEARIDIRPSRSVPPLPSHDLPPLHMKFPPGPGRSAPPPDDHPFVARPALISTPSGEVERMFETAMLKSIVHNAGEFNPRRGSGDSGLGSSVNDHGGSEGQRSVGKAFGMSAFQQARGSAFGPPETVIEASPPEHNPELLDPSVESGAPKLSPQPSSRSPYSPWESLSPSSRLGVMTRTSSGMIDPALAGVASPVRSHESSSSSFSSPRPLNSLDDIESLRDIFYRPSPVPYVSSSLPQNEGGTPPSEFVLTEEDEDASDPESIDEGDHTQTNIGGGDREDWTFGRDPFQQQSDPQLLWERRLDGQDRTPLRIDLEPAPSTPSPPIESAPLPRTLLRALSASASRSGSRSAPATSHTYQDVPESVHDSDSQSERSVLTSSSQRVTNG